MDTLHDTAVRGFASDNYSGVHPEVLAALAAANGGHQISYGENALKSRLRAHPDVAERWHADLVAARAARV